MSSPLNAMTLDQALSASLKHESRLELSRLDVNRSTAMLEQAKQRDGLKINLVSQLDYERIETPETVLFPTEGNRRGRSLQLQLDYPIYTSGRHRLGVDVAKSQVAAQHQAFFRPSIRNDLKYSDGLYRCIEEKSHSRLEKENTHKFATFVIRITTSV